MRTTRAKKRMSLSPQTLRVQNRLAEWTKSGRKHWDLYRWLLDPHILYDATRLVIANGGAAGLDGKTCAEIKGREWEYANELSRQLRDKSYHPRPVRRVYIPKRDGKKRPLGIPDRDDRVIQRALSLLLEAIYEQIFLSCSYGFRPGKKSYQCTHEAANLIYSHRHVLEADIEGFFDNVSHKKLSGMLKEQIVDPRVLRLIEEILKTGFREWNKPWQPTEKGTPQGGPLSPLLANVYLHYALDVKFEGVSRQLRGSQLIRFADDFIIVSKLRNELLTMKRCLYVWMREAKLTLKESKTKMVDMRNCMRSHESKFDFLGFKFHLRSFSDNRRRFWIARQPSERARKALRENLKAKLYPNLPRHEAKELAQSAWRGWVNYFRYGNSIAILHKEAQSVKRILFSYLNRKYRRQKRPVTWKRLRSWGNEMTQLIKPLPAIPDPFRQQQVELL
ncbi:MAG: group II intron reverse transcriptase/maturase [Deltaproteobacteria bacterium]|nr:group II intron reverse transcriptase/maturase [Deltaproteobacteria bacterium]